MIWLIAEDESDILNLLSMVTQVWGHTPLPFESGQKVWDWLDKVNEGKVTDDLPEFALMDIRMPGKRGNEVANRMRTVERLKHIPIVLMTAFSLNEDDKRALQVDDGVDHIINKPLPTFEELRDLLNHVIEHKRANINRS
ncbi:MAG: response regulator [Anaerolineae bacterium]